MMRRRPRETMRLRREARPPRRRRARRPRRPIRDERVAAAPPLSSPVAASPSRRDLATTGATVGPHRVSLSRAAGVAPSRIFRRALARYFSSSVCGNSNASETMTTTTTTTTTT